VGENWLDVYSPEVQDYLVDIALEIQSFGFDEVQFDYIRFPRGLPSSHAIWLHAGNEKRTRADTVAAFLEKVDRALTIPISADVFGLTTLVDGDPRELGQYIESMARYVEAISPMMYANGMDTYFRDGHITDHVIDLIQCGLQRGRYKAKEIVLRPYLQAYANGVEHMWGPNFILEQVLAAERAGSDGFLFWNPTMHNDVTMTAMRSLAQHPEGRGLAPLSHKPDRIKASWCPETGNVFGSATERSKQGKPAHSVATERTSKVIAAHWPLYGRPPVGWRIARTVSTGAAQPPRGGIVARPTWNRWPCERQAVVVSRRRASARGTGPDRRFPDWLPRPTGSRT